MPSILHLIRLSSHIRWGPEIRQGAMDSLLETSRIALIYFVVTFLLNSVDFQTQVIWRLHTHKWKLVLIRESHMIEIRSVKIVIWITKFKCNKLKLQNVDKCSIERQNWITFYWNSSKWSVYSTLFNNRSTIVLSNA